MSYSNKLNFKYKWDDEWMFSYSGAKRSLEKSVHRIISCSKKRTTYKDHGLKANEKLEHHKRLHFQLRIIICIINNKRPQD